MLCLCSMAGFGISGADPAGSATKIYYRWMIFKKKKLMIKHITFTLYRVRTCVAEFLRCVLHRAEPAHSPIAPQRLLTAARSAALSFANAA